MVWEVKKLGEVCKFENGDRGKNYPSRSKFIRSGVLFINAGHLNNYHIDLSGVNYISEEDYELLSRGKFTEGDILFCLRGSLGKFAVVNNGLHGAIASSLVIVRVKERIVSDFLAYYFQSTICRQMIEKFKGGTAQPNLGAKDLSRFEIPIPPLPEQDQIVSILDGIFEKISKAKENAEKNLSNAKEVFESYLQSVFENPNDDWEEKSLCDVCEIINGGTPNTKEKSYWNGKNLWITPKDMGKLNGLFVDETERKITDLGLKNSSAKLLPVNSIILSSRAPIGHLAINKEPMSTNQGCKGIIPKKLLDFLFLYYFLKNSVDLLNSLGSGTTFKELSGSKLGEVQISFPTIKEQQSIVEKLDELSAETKKLESIYNQKLQNLEELKKSILQKAFKGELTEC